MYDINIYVIDMNLWFVISYLLFVRFVITRPVSHFWLISQECRLSQFFSKIQNTSLASYNIFYKYSFSLNFVTKLFLCQIADFLSFTCLSGFFCLACIYIFFDWWSIYSYVCFYCCSLLSFSRFVIYIAPMDSLPMIYISLPPSWICWDS